ncbi:MAG TPA: hypothetical protein VMF08_08240 [Candidatus Sulfotelmatobacter sp.]|nr:hypothetical protein [Candidatus Sulfotelmatobacter sp.]
MSEVTLHRPCRDEDDSLAIFQTPCVWLSSGCAFGMSSAWRCISAIRRCVQRNEVLTAFNGKNDVLNFRDGACDYVRLRRYYAARTAQRALPRNYRLASGIIDDDAWQGLNLNQGAAEG